MKSINLIQFKNKIPLENINLTSTKKKSKVTCVILNWLKNISKVNKNNVMVKDGKKKLLKKQKKAMKTCVRVNFVNTRQSLKPVNR